MSDIAERFREARKRIGLEQSALAERLGVGSRQISNIETGRSSITQKIMETLAVEFGIDLNWLITGAGVHLHAPSGKAISFEQETDVIFVEQLDQRVSAGAGQELLETESIGQVPFVRRMLRGHDESRARGLEVRGDSMTGIQMFDGDLVVFVMGEVRDDGIYVIRIGDELYVKRISFDPLRRTITIMSENPRYPDRTESTDSELVEICGKVVGWIHCHPY